MGGWTDQTTKMMTRTWMVLLITRYKTMTPSSSIMNGNAVMMMIDDWNNSDVDAAFVDSAAKSRIGSSKHTWEHPSFLSIIAVAIRIR